MVQFATWKMFTALMEILIYLETVKPVKNTKNLLRSPYKYYVYTHGKEM